MDAGMLTRLPPGPLPTDLMTSSSVQASGRSRVRESPLSWDVVCTGVVSEEDTVSAWSSLKGLWRWVGLLAEALLLVGSEAVERDPLTVSVRSPSGRTEQETGEGPSDSTWGPWAPKARLIAGGRRVRSSQGNLTRVAPL